MGYKTTSRNIRAYLLIVSISAAAALIGGCARAGASHSRMPAKGVKTAMPITFRLSSYKSHWQAGEDVQIDLIFENHSRKLVHIPDIENPRNWQPLLSLTGPGYVRPLHFNVGAGRLQPGPADQTYRALSLTGIKPGQTYGRSPYLGKGVNLSRAGTYTLSASAQTSLGVVWAAPFTFTVGTPTRAFTSGPVSLTLDPKMGRGGPDAAAGVRRGV